MIRRFILSVLRRFPALYAGLRSAYQHRILASEPVLTSKGFKLAGPANMTSGEFEPAETKLIQGVLSKEKMVFVNIGANCGYFVCFARQMGARVVAIEPLEQNIQLLQRNLLANGWNDVEVLPVALGDNTNLLKLYGGGTAASLVRGWAGAAEENYRVVPVTTMDNVLGDRFDGEKMMVLIDVEGFELNVLRGAKRQLGRNPAPVWLVEITINEHQPAGTPINPNLHETFRIFWDHGYVCEQVGNSSNLLIVKEEDVLKWAAGKSVPENHNFLFRHP